VPHGGRQGRDAAEAAGWNLEEMRNHGTDPKTRRRLVTERLRAILALWTEEQAEYHGDFVDFDPVFCWPKPVRRPHPPIIVGGGERTFACIAEVGAERVLLELPTLPEADSLRELDRRAQLVASFS
jgi:alkanesulfonate monooxygenase SsuD/methylene tetrahydromethanopterin reductase-like flavin-dependent oxidoreductase (luciferase family)